MKRGTLKIGEYGQKLIRIVQVNACSYGTRICRESLQHLGGDLHIGHLFLVRPP